MMVRDMVREFHERFGIAVRTEPVADPPESDLRTKLLAEEVQEYYDAVEACDVVGVAQELADVVYVAYGTALNHGIDLDAAVAEVHRANMSKLGADGRPMLRADGKVIKGPNYRPPCIAEAIGLLNCPRCGSPDPAKHPAVQFEGEVQVCPHPWHGGQS